MSPKFDSPNKILYELSILEYQTGISATPLRVRPQNLKIFMTYSQESEFCNEEEKREEFCMGV
jgi:hypothetical protein